MPRTIWKGAVSFGLVHIPVALVPATTRKGIDFDWLDRRSMDRVGYKRINKTTGEDIDSDNIVKGIEYEKGHYVVLSDEEIKPLTPRRRRPSTSSPSSTPGTFPSSTSTPRTT